MRSLFDSMAADQRYADILRAVHIHPTMSELLPTLLQHLKAV